MRSASEWASTLVEEIAAINIEFTDADWHGLEQVLRGCVSVTDEECAYLKAAFIASERMWEENLAKVATVKLVMLSEAPLFGAAQRYFYNTATRLSSFFYFKDAEEIGRAHV